MLVYSDYNCDSSICSKIFIYDINIEDYEEYSKMDWWSIVDALCRSGQSFESRWKKLKPRNSNDRNKAVKELNEATTKMSKNPNIQRGVIIGGSRAVHNTTRSNAQTTSQPRMVNCMQCYGRGRVQSNDGYVYSCSRCYGTGRIFIKWHNCFNNIISATFYGTLMRKYI